MKNQIFRRKIGSGKDVTYLIRGDGISSDGKSVNPGVIDELVIMNTQRVVKLLQEKGVEGYVLSGGDPTPYRLTSDAGLVYPAVIDQGNIELRVCLSTGGRQAIQTSTYWKKAMACEYPARLITVED